MSHDDAAAAAAAAAWENSLFCHINRVDDCIHIGNREAGHSRAIQQSNGIDYVCRISANPNERLGCDLFMCIGDSPSVDILPSIVSFLAFVDAHKHKQVLVHCDAGASRSGSCVIAYLMRKHSISSSSALSMAQRVRPIISPNAGFMRTLVSLEPQNK